jgi:hypothetical protein
MTGCYQARTGPDVAAHQSQAGMAAGVYHDHRMHHDAVGIALLDRAWSAAALRLGLEFDLCGILNRRVCGPVLATPVRRLQPSTSFAAVTLGSAKNRPARSSPRRSPPSRRRQLSCARLPFEDRSPLYRGADPRMIGAFMRASRLLVCIA